MTQVPLAVTATAPTPVSTPAVAAAPPLPPADDAPPTLPRAESGALIGSLGVAPVRLAASLAHADAEVLAAEVLASLAVAQSLALLALRRRRII